MTMPGGTWTIGRAAFEGLTGMLAGVPGGGDALALPTEPGSLNPCVLFSSGPSKKLKLNSLPASNDTSGVRVSGAGALPRPALSDWSILKTSIVRRGNGDDDGDRAPRCQLRSPFAYSTLYVIRFASGSDVWSLSFQIYRCLSSLVRLFLNPSLPLSILFFLLIFIPPFEKYLSRTRKDSRCKSNPCLLRIWLDVRRGFKSLIVLNRVGRKLRKQRSRNETHSSVEKKKKRKRKQSWKRGFTFRTRHDGSHQFTDEQSGTHPRRIPRRIGPISKLFDFHSVNFASRVPRNFTSKRSSSCFPTNRSNRSSAARTRDNTTTKEATISKKRMMTRRMKKRPQENRRCYGFAKAFLSERFSTPTRSVAVTSSGQILNEAARSRLTNNFGTSTASGHRSAFYLLISRLQKRLRTH